MRIGPIVDDVTAVRSREETIDGAVNRRKVQLIHVLKMPGNAVQRITSMPAVNRNGRAN